MDWRIACVLMAAGLARAAEPVGLFADHSDVGTVLHPGSVVYDAAKHSYTISGSGENVWTTADAFQFVWKKMEGDFTLTADISVLGQGGDPHKKAMLMARQSLDADSAYADVALHGVGLTSLQSRETKGEATHEVQANVSSPKRLRLQKYRDEFSLWIAGEDGYFHFSGAAMRVELKGEFYVGLGVCAHNKDAVETAEFGNVALEAIMARTAQRQAYATLETMTVASTDRRVTYTGTGIGAPRWTPDGASLLFTEDGRIESVPVAGGTPKVVNTESEACLEPCFVTSPGGTMLAVGCGLMDASGMYVAPIGGGKQRSVTAKAPSCPCDWSPDGKTIVFEGGDLVVLGEQRFPPGIYAIPASGGEGTLLRRNAGGCSARYSPDGKYLYFASLASGAMEIWRMRPDGSGAEEVTSDRAGNWSPSVSPDGRRVAFLTVQSRLDSDLADVALRVMSLADSQVRVLARFTSSLGEAPSWSPDGRRLAFSSRHETWVAY